MANKCIVIVGPTASGKSAYAVHVAERIRGVAPGHLGEVISADSRQVYTGLDIGTAKITNAEMRGVPHHLLDVADPYTDTFSAHDFLVHASRAAHDIWQRGGIPIICGGTGFFIDVLCGRITLPDVPRDDTLRAELADKSAAELLKMLYEIDPARAKVIEEKGEEHNTVRLVRAIEVALSRKSHFYERATQPFAKQTSRENSLVEAVFKADPRTFSREGLQANDTLWLGLCPTDAELREKIRTRLHERLEAGMLDEVRRLHAEGLSWERMEALGLEYRYCARHLQGLLSYEDFVTTLEQKIWQYAKRQLTYWRRNEHIHWHHPSGSVELDALVIDFLRGS